MIAQLWQRIREADAEAFYLFGAALALVVALWGFAELADEVIEGETRAFDIFILNLFRLDAEPAIPIGPHWLLIVARDITALGGYSVLTLFTAIAAGYALMLRRLAATILILAAAVGGVALSTLLKQLFGRVRPDIVPHLVEVSTPSFPSGHAMLSAAIYLSLGAILAQLVTTHRQRLYILGTALLLTGLIGFSRVFLGVHYPSDVLAGWAVGLAWAILCWLATTYLQRGSFWRDE